MPKMQCIATCQYRCVTRKGDILDIPDADMTEDIIKNNFIATAKDEPPALHFANKGPFKAGKEAPNVTVGTEKKTADQAQAGEGKGNAVADPNEPPPPADAPPAPPPPPDFTAMTCKDLKTWLDANQVQFNTRMLQDELVKLATQAYALITKE